MPPNLLKTTMSSEPYAGDHACFLRVEGSSVDSPIFQAFTTQRWVLSTYFSSSIWRTPTLTPLRVKTTFFLFILDFAEERISQAER